MRKVARARTASYAPPTGFRDAYARYVEGGWPSMTQPESLGGQGLPESLGTILSEMNGTANWGMGDVPGTFPRSDEHARPRTVPRSSGRVT